MLKTASQEFREFFILEFTRESIKQFVKEKKPEFRTKELESPRQIQMQPSIMQRNIPTMQKISQIKKFIPMPKPLLSSLREEPLPLRLQYLHPVPKEINMELGKLNSILKDPAVISLECDGSGKNIIVNNPSQRITNIILTKEEIDSIISEFSNISKIPLQDGIYKVAAGRYILLAAISEVIEPKFIIKKIPFVQQQMQRY